jgi:hypothetical protein
MHTLAFALTWDPELHGLLIVLLALVLLPGSVYLLLSTNLGARVGFLIAVAGFFGWMTLMAIVWTVYGIGLKGNPNSWQVKTMVVGDVANSSNVLLEGFPQGWKKLTLDTPEVAEAAAAADPTLAPTAASGKTGPYATSSDYLPVGAYEQGGHQYFPGWNDAPKFIAVKHTPHYFVLVVQKSLKQPTVPGQPPPKAAADPHAPQTAVLIVRNLGTLRQPAAVLAGASFITFGVCCYVLHRRDKQTWAARGTALEPVGRG